MTCRNTSLAAIALFATLLVAPGTAGALAPPVDVKASKSAQGPYTDDTQDATVKPGKTKLFFWQVTRPKSSASDGNLEFDDAATHPGDGYKVKWYRGKKPRAKREITNQASNSGYPFFVAEGKSKYFTAKVKTLSDQEPLCLGGQASDPDLPYADSAYFSVNGLCT